MEMTQDSWGDYLMDHGDLNLLGISSVFLYDSSILLMNKFTLNN